MVSATDLKSFGGTVVACTLVAAVAFWGTKWFLGSDLGPGLQVPAMEFSAAVHDEPNDFKADFQAAIEVIEQRYSYLEHRTALGELDLAALIGEARTMLGAEPDQRSFYNALRHLVAGLHDGHAFVMTKDMMDPALQQWPFRLTEVQEGVVVASLAENIGELLSDSDGEGAQSLQLGDELVAVDGRAINEWIRDAEAKVYASSDASRRQQAIEHIVQWDEAADRSFLFRSADGSERELRFPHPYLHGRVPQVELYPTDREHRMLDDNVAYFRPGNFSPPRDSGWPGPPEGRDAILADTYSEFDRIIGELMSARALILDLRGNPGGTDLLGQFLVDRLVDEDYIYFQLSALRNNGWGRFGKHESSSPDGKHSMAGKPLAVIVDPNTFSTADNVAACLRDVHPDVRFFGRPNGAGSGAPRSFELPRTGSSITFCTQRVKSASGRMTEGVTVKIDVPVIWKRADVLNGNDPDLEAAFACLKP